MELISILLDLLLPKIALNHNQTDLRTARV